ncbi:MAG: hypothetical protein AB7U41_07030 [Dongiaceae bacterium]
MIKQFLGKNSKSGFAIGYFLMAIALFAALTGALSLLQRGSSQGLQNDKVVNQIYSQASKIKADILVCMVENVSQRSDSTGAGFLSYPSCDGDPAQSGIQAGGATPDTANYCVSGGTTIYANAAMVTCKQQGNLSVWDASDGNFFPDPIPGFGPWRYVIESSAANAGGQSARGVSILITSATNSADADWIVRQVVNRFGPREAMVLRHNTLTDLTPGSFLQTAPATGQANAFRLWLAR